MNKTRAATRVGAAAFALGLSLAGPQAVDVASADSSDTDSTSASAASGSSGVPGVASRKPTAGRATRAGRSAAAAGSATREIAVVRAEVPALAGERRTINPAAGPRATSATAPMRPADAMEAANSAPELTPAKPGSVPQSAGRRASRQLAPVIPAATVVPFSAASDGATPDVGLTVAAAAPALVASLPAPRAMTAAGTGLLVQVNAAVTNWFDSSANWLSGLPPNPVAEFLEGALLLVRRSLFNQAPTLDPVQLKTLVNGQILGTLGAIDPEGDTLSYTLTGIPQEGVVSGIFREPAGTVQISPDGSYVYTPGLDFSGYDSFTVTVDDGGFNILDPFGSWRPAQAVVSVGVPGSPPDGASASGVIVRSLQIFNLTGTPLMLSSRSIQRDGEAAGVGTVLQPGEEMTVTLTQYVFVNNLSTFVFTPTADTATQAFTTYFNLRTVDGTQWGCSGSGSICETTGSTTLGTAKLVLLDAPGTVIRVPSGQGQQQSDVLNQLCGTSIATCTFQPKTTGSYFGDWRLASDSVSNLTSSPLSTTITVTTTTSTTDTLKLKAGVKVGVAKIVEVAFEVEYNRAWTQTYTFSQAITVTAQPGEKVSISTRNPTTRVNGDFTLVMRNTTWVLSDVEFESPDGERSSEYRAITTPITPLARRGDSSPESLYGAPAAEPWLES